MKDTRGLRQTPDSVVQVVDVPIYPLVVVACYRADLRSENRRQSLGFSVAEWK